MTLRYLVALMLLGVTLSNHGYSDAPPERSTMRMIVEANTLSLDSAGCTVLSYRYGDAPYKPYVKTLTTPSGVNILLDSPPDHIHHRGLMFGLAIDQTEFWSELDNAGKQIHQQLGPIRVLPSDKEAQAAFEESLKWIGPADKDPMLAEKRTLSFQSAADYNLLTWSSCLRLPDGKKQSSISGSHYYGVGMRFVPGMDKTGRFFNEAGDPGVIFRGEERLMAGRWCAYTAQGDNHPVTVAMFDSPGNPRAATWFTMKEPFAYLSATLKYHTEPLTLTDDESLRLTYAVAVWDGVIEFESIQQAYNLWLKHLPQQESKNE